MRLSCFSPLTLFLALFCVFSACANTPYTHELETLRTQWAIAKFQLAKNKQLPELERLIKKAELLNKKYPNQPDIMSWTATIMCTHAALKGGFGVLGETKKAKALLEEAIRLEPGTQQGLAQGVLGALYAKVPGWPVAFGSQEKARKHLQAGVQISPEGGDTNFYYGEYLLRMGEYREAKKYLELAQHAPIRKGFEIQDRGRKEEIALAINKLQRLSHY